MSQPTSLPVHPEDIAALYPPHGRAKLVRYCREHKADFFLDPRQSLVRTIVVGSAAYQVSFDPARMKHLEDFSCTCPAVGLCVHRGTAWASWLLVCAMRKTSPQDISWLANGMEEAGASLQATGNHKQATGALIQATGDHKQATGALIQTADHMQATGGGVSSTGGSSTGGPETGRSAASRAGRGQIPSAPPLDEVDPSPRVLGPGKAFTNGFVLDRLRSAFGSADADAPPGPRPGRSTIEPWRPGLVLDFREGRMEIRLVLHFLKKDGSPGRTREYQAALAGIPALPRDQWWVEILSDRGSSLDLDQAMGLAARPDCPGLPLLRSMTGAEIRLTRAEGLIVVFEPWRDPWAGDTIHHRGRSLIRDPEGHEHEVAHWYGGCLDEWFLCKGNVLATRPRSRECSNILGFLDECGWKLDPEGLALLETMAASRPVPGLEIRILGRTVREQLWRGQCMIHLGTGRETLGTDTLLSILTVRIDWDPLTAAGPEAVSEGGAMPGEGPESADGLPANELPDDWLQHLVVHGETATLLVRDLDWEGRVLAWVEDLLGPRLERNEDAEGFFYRETRTPSWGNYRAMPPPGSRAKLRQLDEARDLYWKGSCKDFLEGPGSELLDQGCGLVLEGQEPIRKARLRILVNQGMDWLDLEPVIDPLAPAGAPGSRARKARKARQPDAGRRIELERIQDLLHLGLHRSSGKDLILLGAADRDRLARLLAAGVEPGKSTRVSANSIGLLAGLDDPELRHLRSVERARDLVGRLERIDSWVLEDIPQGFLAQLRPYQHQGFSWLCQMVKEGLGACLADDMGLGKTVQTLALIRHMVDSARNRGQEAPCRVLLVVPLSTLPNWESECHRFCPGLTLKVHGGPQRAQDSTRLGESLEGVHILALSYGTVRNDAELLSGIEWDCVVLDEAHVIKNPESATFKAVRTLKARARLSLTGTPLENSVLDLWSQFEFLNPGILGSLKRFRSRYGFGAQERADEGTMAALRKITSPFVLRRRKDQVRLDLPPKEEIVLWCDLDEEQEKVYRDIHEACRMKVDDAIRKDGLNNAGLTILEALLRLRQACLFPGLISPDLATARNAKLEVFRDLAAELAAEGHKALVFSQFTTVLDQLGAELATQKLPHVRLDGSTRDRAGTIERFRHEDCRFFLLSLKAGGVGINLTEADYVVLFDPWWNPAAENQAVDRAHRIGQERPVMVYRLVVRGTVEEKILELQERKRELFRSVVDQDPSGAHGLSAEDLLGLLG